MLGHSGRLDRFSHQSESPLSVFLHPLHTTTATFILTNTTALHYPSVVSIPPQEFEMGIPYFPGDTKISPVKPPVELPVEPVAIETVSPPSFHSVGRGY